MIWSPAEAVARLQQTSQRVSRRCDVRGELPQLLNKTHEGSQLREIHERREVGDGCHLVANFLSDRGDLESAEGNLICSAAELPCVERDPVLPTAVEECPEMAFKLP